MKSLREFYAEHAGRTTDKWSLYLDLYDQVLAPWRDAPVSMLEIGIQNGGSLEIWPRYFPAGRRFVGCDINPDCSKLTFADERVSVIVADANTDEAEARIAACAQSYDIIIDDGSHTSPDIVRSFARYFPRVNPGGIFIAEDLHCSYWTPYEGGVHHPFSSMNFFKHLVDVVNHEHWGVPHARRELLAGVLEHYGVAITEEDLAEVHSVAFANSLCFIRKKPAGANVLGPRVLAGSNDTVLQGLLALHGGESQAFDERANPFSARIVPPGEILTGTEKILRELQVSVALQRLHLEALQGELREADAKYHRLVTSRGWRLLDHVRPLVVRLKQVRNAARALNRKLRPAPAAEKALPAHGTAARGARDVEAYRVWLQHEAVHAPAEVRRASDEIAAMPAPPLISILMPVYNAPEALLRQAVESVQAQIYTHWELCIADDASTDSRVREVLAEIAARDPRVKVVCRDTNGHISRATNSCLEIARGEFIALLDHDDALHPLALHHIAREIVADPGLNLVYTDEDKIDAQGARNDPYCKCDFNYELFLAQNMICHLGAYRRSIALAIGGFRAGFEGAQDHDFALRFLEACGMAGIRHVPRVLYHWRAHAGSTAAGIDAKPYATEAARRAVTEHLARMGLVGEAAVADPALGTLRVRFGVPDPEPSVDIVIPTRDRADLMEVVLRTVFEKTDYRNFRVIIVDNGSVEPATLQLFEHWKQQGRVSVLRIEEPFNFSLLNNRAVASSQAEFVCLLNNDIEVTDGAWLRELVSHAARPGVGCVGARLWYPDGTLQHGGVVLGVGGVAGHAHKRWPHGDPGYFGRAVLHQAFSAVTAACLLIRRSTYLEVGGLDETLQVAFNDVDFCIRVREAGYRNVWTPYAELVHHESVSRGLEDTPAKQERFTREVRLMQERWGDLLRNDPMYSPNLSLRHEDFSLRDPRVEDAPR